VCGWYGGSREGARDVNIWLSHLDQSRPSGSNWSAPLAVMDNQRARQGSEQFVKKVGNALLFHDDKDRLWMLYVSIAFGGWSTSSLNATYSTDGGATWSPSQRLWLSPMFNISELVRCPAVRMSCGEIGIPIYHECAGVFPEMLWLRPGESKLEYRKSRLCGGREWLQPSVVPTGPQSAICYLRCANESRRVGFQTTSDAGESWNSPELLDLPNPNSAVCGLLMSDSAVLLALNHSLDKRDSFSLVYSANGISEWKVVAELDEEPDQKFSYPTMMRDRTGMIHLVYSWRMQKLRHVSFNDAWVYQQLNQSQVAIAASPFSLGRIEAST
jgi:predicted neuraminidase